MVDVCIRLLVFKCHICRVLKFICLNIFSIYQFAIICKMIQLAAMLFYSPTSLFRGI